MTKQRRCGRVNVRIDGDIQKWIESTAARRRVDKSEVVREILLQAFDSRPRESHATGEAEEKPEKPKPAGGFGFHAGSRIKWFSLPAADSKPQGKD